MIQRGRPKQVLELSGDERSKLTALADRPKSAQALALRARIVLRCAAGHSNTTVAREQRVTVQTVGKWRRRFLRLRLAGLTDAPRSGAPRTITDAKVERVVTLTLERKPAHATQWSTRSLAKRCGLTHDAVHRIWRAFGLKPHRQEAFQLSTDPFFVEKVRDVVGLYLKPPANAQGLQRQILDQQGPPHYAAPNRHRPSSLHPAADGRALQLREAGQIAFHPRRGRKSLEQNIIFFAHTLNDIGGAKA